MRASQKRMRAGLHVQTLPATGRWHVRERKSAVRQPTDGCDVARRDAWGSSSQKQQLALVDAQSAS